MPNTALILEVSLLSQPMPQLAGGYTLQSCCGCRRRGVPGVAEMLQAKWLPTRAPPVLWHVPAPVCGRAQ